MTYVFQNDERLHPDIRKIGCFFRAALNMAEMKAGKALSSIQINRLWDMSKKYGFIGDLNNEKNCVIASAPIANMALQELSFYGQFVEVATFKDGEMDWYKSVKDRRVDSYIQKIRQSGPSKTHFRCVDKLGNVIFDPYFPAIKPLSICYTICFRFDRKGL